MPGWASIDEPAAELQAVRAARVVGPGVIAMRLSEPAGRRSRLPVMPTRTVLIAPVLALLVLSCAGQGPTPTPPTPTPSPAGPTGTLTPLREGVEGLVEDLTNAGADAALSGSFSGAPLAVEAGVVCIDGKEVRVYSYSSEEERAAVSARIDPNEPSNIGTSIVEWDGWPQFWQRDRILVLYLGNDEATIERLKGLLGEPFAQGQARPQRLPGSC